MALFIPTQSCVGIKKDIVSFVGRNQKKTNWPWSNLGFEPGSFLLWGIFATHRVLPATACCMPSIIQISKNKTRWPLSTSSNEHLCDAWKQFNCFLKTRKNKRQLADVDVSECARPFVKQIQAPHAGTPINIHPGGRVEQWCVGRFAREHFSCYSLPRSREEIPGSSPPAVTQGTPQVKER